MKSRRGVNEATDIARMGNKKGREIDTYRYEIKAIKDILRIPQDHPLPQCGHKSEVRARALAEDGDPTHLDPKHLCEKCRCTITAGYRTQGWFYWPEDNDSGLRDVGHLGVGPCAWHACSRKGKKGILYEDRIQKEILAMQQKGLAPLDGGRFRAEIASGTEDATLRRDVRMARETVKNQLDSVMKKLNDGVDLTENFAGRAVPMSDKSRIELVVSVSKALADIGKSEFLTGQNDYVHRDEMIIFVNKILQICEQYIKVKDDWDSFISQFKQALFDVRSGKRRESNRSIEL